MATQDVFSAEELARLRGFPEINRAELIRYFTLTGADEAFVRQFRTGRNVLGVAIQLCTLPWLGFVPDEVAMAPDAAVGRLSQRLGIAMGELRGYGHRIVSPPLYDRWVSEASDPDELLDDAWYLVTADPGMVRPLLPLAASPAAQLAADVYRTSALWHRHADPATRRQLLALDAARWGAEDLARRIAAVRLPDDGPQWNVRWATGSDIDPRLGSVIACVPVDAWATCRYEGRLIVVTVSDEHFECGQETMHDCEQSVLRVFDADTGDQLRAIEGAGGQYLAVVKLDGQLIAVVGKRGKRVRLWRLVDGLEVGRGLYDHIEVGQGLAIARLGDRPIVVTVGFDGRIRRWDLPIGREIGEPLGDPPRPIVPSLSPLLRVGELDGRPIVVAAALDVRVWDLASGDPVGVRFAGNRASGSGLATALIDGRFAVVTAHVGGTVLTWDVATGQPIGRPLQTGVSSPEQIAVTTVAGQPILLVSDDFQVTLWNLASGENAGPPLAGTGRSLLITTTWDEHPVVLTATGRGPASMDTVVRRWELGAKGQHPLPLRGHKGQILATSIAGDDRMVVTAGADGTVRRWRAGDGTPLGAPLRGHPDRVAALACAQVADRHIAVTGGGNVNGHPDEGLRRWDLTEGRELGELLPAGHGGETQQLATATVAGRTVVLSGGNDGRIAMWDLVTGALLGEQHGEYPVTGLATGSTEDRPIAAITRSLRDPVRLWDLTNLATVTTRLDKDLPGGETVKALIQLHGRATLVTVDGWSSVRLWDVTDGTLHGADQTDNPHYITAMVVAEVAGGPVAAVARIDSTVRLVNLETRRELGPALRLPSPPWAMALSQHGELVVCFGADTALVTLDD